MSQITCPNCKHSFETDEFIRNEVTKEVSKELREKMSAWQKTKEADFANREAEYQKQLALEKAAHEKRLVEERNKLAEQAEEQIRRDLSFEFSNKLLLLEKTNLDYEEKLRTSQQRELEYLQLEKTVKIRETQMELELQRKLIDERTKLSQQIKEEEQQKIALKETEWLLKAKEYEEQLNSQKKMVDEMKRKAEQGNNRAQGEAQELLIEETLKATFPYDEITEVSKGKRGADCIQIVRNNFGQECGKIYYESKRAESFAPEWIEKMREDMRNLGTDMGIIVTKTLPKDLERFGLKDGIWVCTFTDLKLVSIMLRESILKVALIHKNQENKGDKMVLLYSYLTSTEFNAQWQVLREGFLKMRTGIIKEREAMEKIWSKREKQLDNIIRSVATIKGSVEGISGNDNIQMNLLEEYADEEE